MSHITMCVHIAIMGIKHPIRLGAHKSIFLATSVTKTLDHNIDTWKSDLIQLEQEYRQQSAQVSLLWKESKKLRELQVLADKMLRKQGQREREQQHWNRHQDKQEERLW